MRDINCKFSYACRSKHKIGCQYRSVVETQTYIWQGSFGYIVYVAKNENQIFLSPKSPGYDVDVCDNKWKTMTFKMKINIDDIDLLASALCSLSFM